MPVFNFPVDPVAKGRPRFTKQGRAYTPKKTKEFETLIKKIARDQYKNGPMKQALSATIVFYFKKPKTVTRDYPTVKPDVDNCVKSTLDSLNGIVFVDDAQIIEINASKKYAAVGGIFLDIRPYLE